MTFFTRSSAGPRTPLRGGIEVPQWIPLLGADLCKLLIGAVLVAKVSEMLYGDTKYGCCGVQIGPTLPQRLPSSEYGLGRLVQHRIKIAEGEQTSHASSGVNVQHLYPFHSPISMSDHQQVTKPLVMCELNCWLTATHRPPAMIRVSLILIFKEMGSNLRAVDLTLEKSANNWK